MSSDIDEQAFVATFVDQRHRARWRDGLRVPKRRRKLLERLWDSHGDWRTDVAIPLKMSGSRSVQIDSLAQELSRRGGGDSVSVLAAADEHDGAALALRAALERFIDDGGAVLICIPTKLALHFSESGPPVLLTTDRTVGRRKSD